MSRQDDVLGLLLQKSYSDSEIARNLGYSVLDVQSAVHFINVSKKKFNVYSVIRSGRQGEHIRELVTKKSSENNIIENADKKGTRAIKLFDDRHKLCEIAVNTRQGQKNRLRMMHSIMKSNLNMSIEVQKLLQ